MNWCRDQRCGPQKWYNASLVMIDECLQNATPFRYETESGFALETFNHVLPTYCPDTQTLGWFDFADPQVQLIFTNLLSNPNRWRDVEKAAADAAARLN